MKKKSLNIHGSFEDNQKKMYIVCCVNWFAKWHLFFENFLDIIQVNHIIYNYPYTKKHVKQWLVNSVEVFSKWNVIKESM